MSGLSINVLTLNCWGVPVPVLGGKHRKLRMQEIGRALAAGDYHIVMLQEVWSNADFDTISSLASSNLPHSFYFYSGLIGSGIAVLSKFPITDTLFFRFQLNGFPHKILHGDWFGGKGVGLCRLHHPTGLVINVYTTHIHAEYSRDKDEYLAHRIAQSYEISQFVRISSGNACDLVIVGGDLNFEPTDCGYHLLLNNANLKDAWVNKFNPVSENEKGSTCDKPSNCYASRSSLESNPEGKRIDYILYCGQNNQEVVVEKCQVTFGRIPDKDINYSDHEGVLASLKIGSKDDVDRNPTTSAAPALGARQNEGDDTAESLQDSLLRAADLVQTGMENTEEHVRVFYVVIIICFMISLWPIGAILQNISILIFVFAVVMALCIKPIEHRCLTGIRNGIRRRLADLGDQD